MLPGEAEPGRRMSLRFLEDLMAPQPLIAPDFLKTQFTETVESRLEILNNVVRAVFVHFRVKAAEEKATGLQALPQVRHCFGGIHQMLKNIHRRHQIKGVGGKARAFEVDEAAGQPALAEAPLAEIQHRRADVGQRHLQPVPGEQNSTGTNPGESSSARECQPINS